MGDSSDFVYATIVSYDSIENFQQFLFNFQQILTISINLQIYLQIFIHFLLYNLARFDCF